uniref:Obg-like ATPase 1 n=1 Tax=Panagrolaimus sp. ES5 TaxID=591445 RepID=A0AC34FJ91_9BILA
MPPKKAVEEKRPPIFGRMGTNLKMGILGLPNVGKSTFFNVLTKSSAQAENFPFCTIDPNESRVAVQDERFDWLCEHYKPLSKVPAYLNVVDIAGLVKGASEGQGLGNAFLSHVGACEALFHLCRAFEDEDVTHVEGDVNPTRDLEIIGTELRLKDMNYLEGAIDKAEKLGVRAGDKTKKAEYDCLVKVKEVLESGKAVRHGTWTDLEIEILNKHLFLTAKPIVYLVNLTELDYIRKKNKWLPKIKQWIDENDSGGVLIPFSGAFENKVLDMDENDRQEFYKNNSTSSSLDKIVKTGYKALQLEYFFTSGKDEVKAWTIQKGTKAPQAAGRIHTDFEKGFIMAEVMKAADLMELGSETAVKAAGKYRQQGKTYVVEDGDIILFKFNAGAGLTAAKKK